MHPRPDNPGIGDLDNRVGGAKNRENQDKESRGINEGEIDVWPV
jgi:hypothetical protein